MPKQSDSAAYPVMTVLAGTEIWVVDAAGDTRQITTDLVTGYVISTFSTDVQALLAATDFADFRDIAGLQIGADIQGFHANLSAFAGLTLIADRLPYGNGAGTLGLATFTAAGRALIDDADAAAQRTTLGLGTSATLDSDTATDLGAGSASNSKLATQLAVKTYIDNIAAGLDIKPSVKCATTGNIALTGEQTLDGVLTSTSRVLVKSQTAPAENGIYVTAAGAWARATDLDAWVEVPAATVWVEEGATLADTVWVSTANTGGTIGSTSMSWTQFGGAGAAGALLAAANLADVASASASRNNLGLAIGTHVQAYSANLDTFAAIAPAANVQSILGAANYAAVNTLLGIGSAGLLASDTDTALAANSDSRIATQKATKAYVDAAVGGVSIATASSAETTAGASTTKAVTPDGLRGSDYGKRTFILGVTNPAGSALATGDGQFYVPIPAILNGWNLDAVQGDVTTVSSSGLPTVQLARIRAGTPADMLSTKLTIDANETTSATAATAAVIDTGNDDVNTGDQIRVDVDVAGTGAKGLTVSLTFKKP